MIFGMDGMNNFKLAVSTIPLHQKIPSGSSIWPKFNASFKNEEMSINEILDVIYYGQSITTQHSNNWRTAANYLLGQNIGLDFDTEDKTSSIVELKKDKFISKHAAFIHTTMSHRPEAPRARVMFVLDRPIMHAKNYTLAATALLWLFGTADKSCKDSVRFWYGSRDCEMEYLGNVLPLSLIIKTIKNYQASGAAEKKKRVVKYHAPASQQEVKDALNHIPAWGVGYEEWVNVLMGIHSEFGDGGLALAESWGDGKQGEVQQKFRSFKESGNVTGKISIATVYSLAKTFGWSRK